MHFHWDGRTIWLFVASMIAGALNAVAGGGSFLSFPALLNVGVPPIQANATNTVAIWPGQLTSIAAYFEDLKHNLRMVLPLSLAAVMGGVAGGIVLLHTEQQTFMRLVPWLLLIAALLFAVSGPLSRWLERRTHSTSVSESNRSQVLLFLGMVVVCFYIGYFGAGSGFLIISLLALFGLENLNQINALKVVTTTLANGVAVVVFIVNRQVLWQHCLLMMLAAAGGGYFGARFARRVNQKFMRGVVVAIGLGMAAYFFWRQS